MTGPRQSSLDATQSQSGYSCTKPSLLPNVLQAELLCSEAPDSSKTKSAAKLLQPLNFNIDGCIDGAKSRVLGGTRTLSARATTRSFPPSCRRLPARRFPNYFKVTLSCISSSPDSLLTPCAICSESRVPTATFSEAFSTT